jgi:hypothetical protein
MFTKDDSCYSTSGRYCAAIEFYLSEHKRRAFCTSQLIEYTLEPNPDAADDKDIPPQRLALVFSTADVEVLGWRLAPWPTGSRKTTWPPSASCPNATPTWSATSPTSPSSASRPLPRDDREKVGKARKSPE